MPTFGSLAALRRDTMATFVTAAESVDNNLLSVCEVVNTPNKASQKHEYLDDAPVPEEFKDEVVETAGIGGYVEVENKVYTSSIALKYDDWRRNNTGSFMRRVADTTVVAANYPQKLVSDKIVAGTTDLAYAGIALYSSSHAAAGDGDAYDNLLAGAGDALANIVTDINEQVLPFFATVQGTNGEPFHADMGLREITFVYPPGIAGLFRTVITAGVISSTDNSLKGMAFKGITDPRLSDANDWYAFTTGGSKKALIYQVDENLRADQSGLTDYDSFVSKRKLKFATSQAAGVGLLFPQATCKVVNS